MVTLADILSFVKDGGTVRAGSASPGTAIKGGRTIREAGPSEFSFLSLKFGDESESILRSCKAPLVIVDASLYDKACALRPEICFVSSEEPKALMIACLKKFFEEKRPAGIHATAIIDSSVTMGKDNAIGPYSVIDKDVVIGDQCTIESFVHIKAGTRIGNGVLVKSGTVIGGKGFGYVQQADGRWENFPHFGRVILEDNVEIGSNTCIDRGALGDTVLKKGVKVDNLVHIAHNVTVGENSLVIADAMIGGSTVIGPGTWVAPSAVLRNGIHVGANCVIGMGAVVTRNVADGTTVAGNPAKTFEKKE